MWEQDWVHGIEFGVTLVSNARRKSSQAVLDLEQVPPILGELEMKYEWNFQKWKCCHLLLPNQLSIQNFWENWWWEYNMGMLIKMLVHTFYPAFDFFKTWWHLWLWVVMSEWAREKVSEYMGGEQKQQPISYHWGWWYLMLRIHSFHFIGVLEIIALHLCDHF